MYLTEMNSRTISYEAFHYVVHRKEADPCFFGSKIPRNTAPIGKGLSPFQKRQQAENFPKTGPGYYCSEKYKRAFDTTLYKAGSLRGAGPLASRNDRFKIGVVRRTPSPGRYEVKDIWREPRKEGAPFGSWSKRLMLKGNKLPGPGTYTIRDAQCRRTKFMYNLGKPKVIPATEIICVTRPSDVCTKCSSICQGDYWHKNHATYLCHPCWNEEKYLQTMFTKKELATFKKIRDCSFVHRHERTTAAVRLLPQKSVDKRLKVENYLNLYIKC